MELILWRHAEAEDIAHDLTDDSRCLTKRGKKQAEKMADWLNQHLPKNTLILVSPAMRTRQTAFALGRKMELEPLISTSASVADHLTACGWPDKYEAVVLVGHQPTLGQLAAKLLNGKQSEWSVKKGAVLWFSQRSRNEETQTLLKAAITTDML